LLPIRLWFYHSQFGYHFICVWDIDPRITLITFFRDILPPSRIWNPKHQQRQPYRQPYLKRQRQSYLKRQHQPYLKRQRQPYWQP
jgi:RNA recognition motif-containing protein